MLVRFTGLLLFSLALLPSAAIAADGNKEIFSPWTSAPSCPSGRACIYHLASGGQLYVVDGNGATQKIHAAKSFRTSANCAGLSSPANGDVCYDTTLTVFRVYAGGWVTLLSSTSGTIVYATVTGGESGVAGAATIYLRGPGLAAYGTYETVLSVAPRAGYLRNLRCFVGTAPGGADTAINTARINGVGSALACTITGAGTTCSNTSSSPAVAAGDRLSIQVVSSAATASDLACSFEVTN